MLSTSLLPPVQFLGSITNIYLQDASDRWFANEVEPRLKGEALLIRFADDAVLVFALKEDAERVMEVLPKRFGKYGLTIHPEKNSVDLVWQASEERARDVRTTSVGEVQFLGLHTLLGAES